MLTAMFERQRDILVVIERDRFPLAPTDAFEKGADIDARKFAAQGRDSRGEG